MIGENISSFQPALKHSGLGIASFVLSLITGLGEFLGIGLAGTVTAANPNVTDETSQVFMWIGSLVCGGLVLNILGVILGIVGLVQPGQKKVFSTLGLIFNVILVLGIALLMIIGVAAS